MDKNKSIRDYFIEALDMPMSITGKEGVTIMPLDAMTKAVVYKAAKGDVAAIMFLQNMTRQPDIEAEKARQKQRATAIKQNTDRLRHSLEEEGTYSHSLDIELEQLAVTLTLIQSIDEQMQSPDYQDLLTDFRKDGTMQPRINPLHEWRDQYRKQFRDEWKELRADALRRKMMRK